MTEKPGSRAPRAKRGVLIGVAVGLVALGVVAAWTLARAELGTERARAALVHVLGVRLGARVTLRQVELSWAERRMRAHEVTVRGSWGVVTARELSANVSWLDLVQGELAPDGFELRGADVHLDARAGAGGGKGGAGVDLAALRSLRLYDSTFSVQLPSGGVVTLTGARLELDAQRVVLVAQRGSYAADGGRTLALGGVELKGRRRGQALSFEQGALSLGGARVALSALELPAPLGHSARGRLHAEGALGPLLALALGLDGTTATPAPAAAAALDARAVIDGTFALGPRGASFELDATHQRTTLHLSRTEGGAGLSLRTQLGQSAFTGKAELAGERVQVELVSVDASIADVAASLPALHAAQSAIEGRGKVVLRVEGTVSAPTLALRAELHDATLLGARFERAAFGLQSGTEPGALSIDALSLQTGRSRVLADALVLRPRADGGLDATGELRVEKLPLPSLWRLLGMPEGAAPSLLTGEVDGKVTLAHDAQHERAGARATLDVQLHGASLRGLRFASGKLDATLGADGRIELRSLALREGGASLTLSGTLGGTGPVDVKAKLERLALSQLAAGASAWLGLSGTASGTASFGGSAAAPEARIEVTLDQLALLGIPLGQQALRVELASAAVLARGCGQGASESEVASLRSGLAAGPAARAWLLCGGSRGMHAALALGTADDLPMRGRLALERAALGSLLSFTATGEGKPVPARATFALDLTGGGLRSPGSLSFTLAVRELSIGEGAHALVASAPFELRAKHGALSLQGGELTTEHTRLVLGAEGSLPHARLTAKGAIAAGALLAASPVPLVTDAFGEVGIDAALPLDASPGYFRLEPREAIVHLGPGIALRKVRGSIALEPDGLRLDGVTAVVGGGTLRASGTLRRSGGKLDRYDLALVAQDVEIEPAPRFTLGFDADVRLRSVAPSGQRESKALPTLSGHVRVERFLYGRHIELPEALIAMNQADRRERASYQPARDRVAFDLELEQAAPLLVRNRMIDAELRVQGQARTLHVVGTNQRFGLLGGMEVARGRVLFHGDEFEIARGAVSFGEQTRVAPVFELRAVAKKRTRKDASIVLVAKGDRETFALDIHCDAGAARVLAPPFACAFAHDQLRCDRFEQLATLWSCPVRTELSRAEGH